MHEEKNIVCFVILLPGERKSSREKNLCLLQEYEEELP